MGVCIKMDTLLYSFACSYSYGGLAESPASLWVAYVAFIGATMMTVNGHAEAVGKDT